jgi:hypothetical protein
MKAYAGAIVACVVFLLVVRAVGLFRTPGAVFGAARQALRDLRDASLDDDAKEVRMRRHSVTFGRYFLQITGTAILGLGASLALLWLLDRAGVVPLESVLAALGSWRFVVGAVVVMGGGLFVVRRRRLGS